MRQLSSRQVLAGLLSALAACAIVVAMFGIAEARMAAAISISDLTPADGSTVPAGQQIQVSGFITTDSSIALVGNQPDVSVLIDGTPTQVQFVVGSGALRVGFQTTRAFTAGSHTLQVTARNTAGETSSAQSTFTAVAGATPTAAPTTPTAVATATAQPMATPTAAAQATTVPTATPSVVVTTTPAQLPVTGGVPAGAAPVLSLALGLLALGVGLRRRTR